MGHLHVLFVDTDQAMAEAMTDAIGSVGLVDVEVWRGSIFDADADALVTPTNSFGLMDGGLDLAVVRHFGSGVARRVRAAITADHDGELLVGAAVVVPTGAARPRLLVAAPTMRVPLRLSPASVNPYLAMRAALLAARTHGVRRLAVPGLGTGVGRMLPDRAARQMVAAIVDVRDGGPGPASWLDAIEGHTRLVVDPERPRRRPATLTAD